jgi:hypothetical protein
MLTQETAGEPRLPLLDYSKPPPGIHVRRETLSRSTRSGLVHPHTPPEMLGNPSQFDGDNQAGPLGGGTP